jgi:uncharacterized peroxidase-related enzyme
MSPFASLKNAKSIRDVFTEKTEKYKAALTLAEDVLRVSAALSPKEREVIATYTSHLNQCTFCYESHFAFACSLGASSSELKEVIAGNHANHRLAKVFAYVRKLTLQPSTLTQADFDHVIASGVSEDELKDAIAVCAAFNFFNRIVTGHFIKPDPDGYERSATMINQFGYDGRRAPGDR